MYKFLIGAAIATTALAATPAAAQYYQGQPYGNAYGYNYNNYNGLTRSYMVRIDQLRQRIERNDSRDRISEREARQLRAQAVDLQRRVRSYASNGLNNRERYDLDRRIANLQSRLRYERNDGNNWRGSQPGRDGFIDTNRNGIDDRIEDRGWVDNNRNGIDDRIEFRRRR